MPDASKLANPPNRQNYTTSNPIEDGTAYSRESASLNQNLETSGGPIGRLLISPAGYRSTSTPSRSSPRNVFLQVSPSSILAFPHLVPRWCKRVVSSCCVSPAQFPSTQDLTDSFYSGAQRPCQSSPTPDALQPHPSILST